MFGLVAQYVVSQADCIERAGMVVNAFTRHDGVKPDDYVIAIVGFGFDPKVIVDLRKPEISVFAERVAAGRRKAWVVVAADLKEVAELRTGRIEGYVNGDALVELLFA